MSGISPPGSKLDSAQIIRRSYDDDTNRIRVDAEVTATIGTVEVIIDAAGGDNIAIADETGSNYLTINPEGSINVVLQDSGLTTKNIFNEINNIVSGVTSTIVTYIAPINTKLLSCDFSGTNIAEYSLYIGATLSAKKYTFFNNLNERFDFRDGLEINSGDIITVEVLHNRPDPGNFNVNILVLN